MPSLPSPHVEQRLVSMEDCSSTLEPAVVEAASEAEAIEVVEAARKMTIESDAQQVLMLIAGLTAWAGPAAAAAAGAH